jgi:hypothetical protein
MLAIATEVSSRQSGIAMTGNEARDTDDIDLLEDTTGEKSPPEEDTSLEEDFFFRNPMVVVVNNAFF